MLPVPAVQLGKQDIVYATNQLLQMVVDHVWEKPPKVRPADVQIALCRRGVPGLLVLDRAMPGNAPVKEHVTARAVRETTQRARNAPVP